MSIKITKSIVWITLLFAPIAIIIGHLGNHDLSWKSNQISTFAAVAPYDDWITAAMLLSAVSLIFIGILFSFVFQKNYSILVQFCSMLFGVAATGLFVLARYEETATSLSQLKSLGFTAVRVQSFHDVGLLIFFYSSIFALTFSGIIAFIRSKNWSQMVASGLIGISGISAFLCMTSNWTVHLGFTGNTVGLKQRGSFLLMWIGLVLLQVVLCMNLKNTEFWHESS